MHTSDCLVVNFSASRLTSKECERIGALDYLETSKNIISKKLKFFSLAFCLKPPKYEECYCWFAPASPPRFSWKQGIINFES